MSTRGEPDPDDEPWTPPSAEAPGYEIPTDDGQVPGWGCALGLILLTVLLLLASGACSSLFDPEDDAPVLTTEPAAGEQEIGASGGHNGGPPHSLGGSR